MDRSNLNRQRRLEIREKIECLEEQMCIYPPIKDDTQHAIKKLQDELERLELEYYRQKEDVEVN